MWPWSEKSERADAVPLDLEAVVLLVAREAAAAGQHRLEPLRHRLVARSSRRVHAVDHPVLAARAKQRVAAAACARRGRSRSPRRRGTSRPRRCRCPRPVIVPAPYSPFGMSPSNSRYSSGWSSVCTASRFSSGCSGTPRGSAHDASVPSCSRRRSQCRRRAWCSCTTKRAAAAGGAAPPLGLGRGVEVALASGTRLACRPCPDLTISGRAASRRASPRSSSIEWKTCTRPASRSSCSEKPPVSTAMVSMPRAWRPRSRRWSRRPSPPVLGRPSPSRPRPGRAPAWWPPRRPRWSSRRRARGRRAGRGSGRPPRPWRSWPAPPRGRAP